MSSLISHLYSHYNETVMNIIKNLCWYALKVLNVFSVQYLGAINTPDSAAEKDRQNGVPKRRKIVVAEAEECISDTENKSLNENNGNFSCGVLD